MTMKRTLLAIAVSLVLSTAAFAQGGNAATSGPSTSAAAKGEKKKSGVFRPTKDQITQVQTMLKDKKLYGGEASGKYNDDTRAAIKSFQKDNGLRQTGTLNRATLEKMGIALTDSQKAMPVLESSLASSEQKSTGKKTGGPLDKAAGDAPKRTAPFRATADQIKEVQRILKEKGMYSGEQTGKLDNPTRDGLKKFQDASGLKVTGTLNAVTLEKIGVALTDKQKGDAAATKKQ
jgi:peptidoglycan hydrolase-like protein with peptidoglycan-binding domain